MRSYHDGLVLVDEGNVDGELSVAFDELFCAVKWVNQPEEEKRKRRER